MNRVVVVIETNHDGRQNRLEVSADFLDADFSRNAVLDVFENALRGAGYSCGIDALDIIDPATGLGTA